MGKFLGIVGLIGFCVCAGLIVIALLKNKKMAPRVIGLAASTLLYIVGVTMSGAQNPTLDQPVNPSETNATITAEQKNEYAELDDRLCRTIDKSREVSDSLQAALKTEDDFVQLGILARTAKETQTALLSDVYAVSKEESIKDYAMKAQLYVMTGLELANQFVTHSGKHNDDTLAMLNEQIGYIEPRTADLLTARTAYLNASGFTSEEVQTRLAQ
ncbi:MAG: hypothetical protein RR053_02240 [Evtepia sp.]